MEGNLSDSVDTHEQDCADCLHLAFTDYLYF